MGKVGVSELACRNVEVGQFRQQQDVYRDVIEVIAVLPPYRGSRRASEVIVIEHNGGLHHDGPKSTHRYSKMARRTRMTLAEVRRAGRIISREQALQAIPELEERKQEAIQRHADWSEEHRLEYLPGLTDEHLLEEARRRGLIPDPSERQP